jgi:hypothetical protein
MEVCMAQLPAGETNPLSARSRSSQTDLGQLATSRFCETLSRSGFARQKRARNSKM